MCHSHGYMYSSGKESQSTFSNLTPNRSSNLDSKFLGEHITLSFSSGSNLGDAALESLGRLLRRSILGGLDAAVFEF